VSTGTSNPHLVIVKSDGRRLSPPERPARQHSPWTAPGRDRRV